MNHLKNISFKNITLIVHLRLDNNCEDISHIKISEERSLKETTYHVKGRTHRHDPNEINTTSRKSDKTYDGILTSKLDLNLELTKLLVERIVKRRPFVIMKIKVIHDSKTRKTFTLKSSNIITVVRKLLKFVTDIYEKKK